MTITLKLSSEQEQRLRAGAARQDAETVREILRQAVDSTVEELLRASAPSPKANTLPHLARQHRRRAPRRACVVE